MPRKTPGKLNAPSPQVAFDQLPLEKLCVHARGVFYRMHSINPATKAPWPAVFFGKRGRTRFDPASGTGTLYLGSTLVGALMEIFDDRWGPLGDHSRSLTRSELEQWWVTLVDVPPVMVFDAHGQNLSKIGTDLQVVSGNHQISRSWALRMMRHPAKVGGIVYPSRHDATQRNLALFKRPGLTPPSFDATLQPPAARHGTGPAMAARTLVLGPATLLRDHPELNIALQELEVAILP